MAPENPFPSERRIFAAQTPNFGVVTMPIIPNLEVDVTEVFMD